MLDQLSNLVPKQQQSLILAGFDRHCFNF